MSGTGKRDAFNAGDDQPGPEAHAYQLERLARGELSPEAAEALRQRLGADVVEARLAALRASDRQILAEHAPADVAREVRRRFEGARARAARSQTSRRLLPLGALGALGAAAAILIVARAPQDRQAGVGPAPAPEEIALKGLAPELRVYRKTPSGHDRLQAGTPVHQGDTLQVRYVAAGRRHGAVLSVDGRGSVTLHLPASAGPSATLVPDGERAIPRAYELDDAPGFERFWFVTADAPFATAEVAEALAKGAPLPAKFSVSDVLLPKEPKP